MDAKEITINNAIGLLEECLINGKYGDSHLHAWYRGERSLIERTIVELEEDKAMKELADSLGNQEYLTCPLVS